jgi:hypothetical protein
MASNVFFTADALSAIAYDPTEIRLRRVGFDAFFTPKGHLHRAA